MKRACRFLRHHVVGPSDCIGDSDVGQTNFCHQFVRVQKAGAKGSIAGMMNLPKSRTGSATD